MSAQVNAESPRRVRRGLVAGDVLVYLLATLIGLACHGELESGIWLRVLATWLTFSAAWLAVAPWLGALAGVRVSDWRRLWRPGLAAWLAAPLGAWMRSLWLGSSILPTFALVMAVVTFVLMLIWRAAFGCVWAARHAPGR
jgi:hypothetical protein